MRFFERLFTPLHWLAEICGAFFPEPPPAYIRLTDRGFEIVDRDRAVFQCAWADIVRISAFKADQFTIDQIRLIFEFHSGKEYVLTEDIGGYRGFVDYMNDFLGIDPKWIHEVTYPAFAENRMVIYEAGKK